MCVRVNQILMAYIEDVSAITAAQPCFDEYFLPDRRSRKRLYNSDLEQVSSLLDPVSSNDLSLMDDSA